MVLKLVKYTSNHHVAVRKLSHKDAHVSFFRNLDLKLLIELDKMFVESNVTSELFPRLSNSTPVNRQPPGKGIPLFLFFQFVDPVKFAG